MRLVTSYNVHQAKKTLEDYCKSQDSCHSCWFYIGNKKNKVCAIQRKQWLRISSVGVTILKRKTVDKTVFNKDGHSISWSTRKKYLREYGFLFYYSNGPCWWRNGIDYPLKRLQEMSDDEFLEVLD